MKKYIKLSLLFVVVFSSLFFAKNSQADNSYTDEGVSFYVQNSPSGYSTEGISFYAYSPQTAQPAGTVPIYRYNKPTTGDHFYTMDNTSTYGSYVSEGIAFYAYSSQSAVSADTSLVYRFYNPTTSKHFYTAYKEEKDALVNNPQWGFILEGDVFAVNTSQIKGTLPVYRFYNASNGDHFYTASEEEKKSISQAPVYRFYNPKTGHHFFTASENEKNIVANTTHSGFAPEGIAFSVQTSQTAETSPVFRFNSDSTGDHFYTISEDEKNYLISHPQGGYVYEGVAFYASKVQRPGYYPLYRFNNTSNSDHFYTLSEAERISLLTPPLGPEISVGLWSYGKDDLQKSPFQINANKSYNIKDSNGVILAQLSGGSTASVTYNSGGSFTINGVPSSIDVSNTIIFDATDGDNSTLIFNTNRSNYIASDWRGKIDNYRGKIKVQYYHGADIVGGTSSTVTQIWIDNILPLEQYAWGSAETSGTGPMEHTKVMSTIFRTYGFWYIKYANKYSAYGFKIRSDSGSQNYGGYDWETSHPNVKTAAQNTRSIIASYGGDVALTPYSSWSDGRTRSWEEKWGGTDYPWLISVSDPYGKNVAQSGGSHMVGLIANGSLSMANQGWTFDRILKYYYSGITLPTNY